MELNTAKDIREALKNMRTTTHYNRDLAFKCVQKAQELKDLDLEFDARYEWLHQLVFLNEDEPAIAMFPWFLNVCDKYPGRFDQEQVLWAFKWVVDGITEYHTISLKQIEQLMQEFEQRFRNYGSGEKVILYYKMRHLSEMGKITESLEMFEQYEACSDSGDLDDCEACQPNNYLDIFISAGQYERALLVVEMILDLELSCHNVPKTTYPTAMEAAFMLERWEEAEFYFQAASKKLRANIAYLKYFTSMVLYCTLKGYHVKGRGYIEKQLPFALKTKSDLSRFLFFMACHLFFSSLQKTRIKIALEAECKKDFVPDKDNMYDVKTLSAWFYDKSLEHARLLDKRNQNSFHADLFERMLKFIPEKTAGLKEKNGL